MTTPSPTSSCRPTSPPAIQIQGAREHNLQNVDLEIPLHQFVVLTGVSGSGKSSLAVQTIAAVGQRRLLDSLPNTASMHAQRLDTPDVDQVTNVPPPVLVRWDHHARRDDPRSSVASLLDIERGLAELLARCGQTICPDCQIPVVAATPESIVRDLASATGIKAMIAAPLSAEQRQKGPRDLIARGQVRAIVAGQMVDLTTLSAFPRSVEVLAIIDRLVCGSGNDDRWLESLEVALREGQGRCQILLARTAVPPATSLQIDQASWEDRSYSRELICTRCRREFPTISLQLFDPASPAGQCSDCRGVGSTTAGEGCPTCAGTRLGSAARAIWWRERTLPDLIQLSLDEWRSWLNSIDTTAEDIRAAGAAVLMAELQQIGEVTGELGLAYLSLQRATKTLSAGEIRRLLLARAITLDLSETLLVIEEPAAGLHPVDVPRLNQVLRRPLQNGQSVLVVEHDAEVVAAADHVIELGPRAGAQGGQVVCQGAASTLQSDGETVTGQAWGDLRSSTALPSRKRPTDWLEIRALHGRTLARLDINIPYGALTVVTGPSGSGKTSLVMDALPAIFGNQTATEFRWETVAPPLPIVCATVPATPLTASRQSTVVTWLKAFDDIRQILAESAEAKRRGWTAAQFSFVSSQGLRCPHCLGRGQILVELQVMAGSTVTCAECGGTRYRPEVQEARYRGLSIVDILALTVSAALPVFRNRPQLYQRLQSLAQLGLDYLVLGQPAAQLSGGESQRIRLASRLGSRSSQAQLLLCDEPSTGIHPVDARLLASCCRQLADLGHTLVVVDHQKSLLEAADWIIELGPGAGPKGGRVVAAGSPRELQATSHCLTGRILRGERCTDGAA